MNDNDLKIDAKYMNPLNTSSPEAEERQREIRIAHQPLNWGRAIADFTRVYNQVIADPDNAGEHLDELAKIMGADGPEPDVGPPPAGLLDNLRKE